MATRMNWSWINNPDKKGTGVKCIIYTTCLKSGVYRARITLGERNNSPRDSAWQAKIFETVMVL